MRPIPIIAAAIFWIAVLTLGQATAKPPTLTALEPAGARQGTAVLVKAVGSFEHWPASCWVDDSGLVVTPSPTKGMIWVEAASNLAPGVHWLRLFDEEGATAPRPFLVGTIPETTEVEPNDDPGRAQPIARTPLTINGALARNNDIDGFAVTLKRGETLVASMEANRKLGSPMDGLLQVARSDGIVLAENDDDHGRDPQLIFQAPADGPYIVRTFAFPATPDQRIGYSGGSTYLYRLTLTTGAFADFPYPLAARREESASFQIRGWNVPEGLTAMLGPDASRGANVGLNLPGLANLAEVRLVDHPTATEVEPNPPDAPEPITPPVSVSGRIDEGRDLDAYRFSAKKGGRFLVRVDARSLGLPLDPAFRILDAAGKTLSEADDSGRGQLDAELAFTPPADGDYRVVVRDLNRQGGSRAAYLLTVTSPQPDYQLSLDNDRFTLVSGKPLSITVKVDRTNGFDGEVQVRATDLPEGVSMTPATSEAKGESAKSVKLTLEAASSGNYPSRAFQVFGEVKGREGSVKQARVKLDGFDGSLPPPWLSVVKGEPAKSSK